MKRKIKQEMIKIPTNLFLSLVMLAEDEALTREEAYKQNYLPKADRWYRKVLKDAYKIMKAEAS